MRRFLLAFACALVGYTAVVHTRWVIGVAIAVLLFALWTSVKEVG